MAWALVTGASKGIGQGVAIALARAGLDIVAVARAEEPLRLLQETVQAQSRACVIYTADLSDPEETDEFACRVAEEVPEISVLVNNAGGGIGGRALVDVSDAEWRFVMRLNVLAPYTLTKVIGAKMASRGYGRIVNISSPVASYRVATEVTSAAYVAAKGALLGLTRQSARLLGPRGVTVNAVLPGDVLTAAGEALFANLSANERAAVVSRVPRGSLVTVEEISALVVDLCGEAAGGVLGVSLDVNGGAWMR